MRLVALLILAAATACGEECFDQDVVLGGACMPAVAAAGEALTLEVREECGSPCWDGPPRCSVEVREGEVRLSAVQESCEPPPDEGCITSCEQRVAGCSVPALEAGSYALVVGGERRSTLEVAEGGATECSLATAGGTGGFVYVEGAGGAGGGL